MGAKASKWLKLNSTRYADKRKYGAVAPPKEMLPVEHLRKVSRGRGHSRPPSRPR